jgi:tetratricopeptide (TPR) repeat protein
MGRKKRDKSKRRRIRRALGEGPEPTAPETIQVISYNITFDSMEPATKIPRAVEKQLVDLHELIHENPQEAIPRLEALKDKYPNTPVLYNYLSMAYAGAGDSEHSEAIARENYRRNPGYLFAKVNYAEVCLQKGDYEEIPRIFNQKYDLKLLYPHRDEFHVSEVVGFMGIMGTYFAEIGEFETADRYYQILEQLDPDHPITTRLGVKLVVHALSKLFDSEG